MISSEIVHCLNALGIVKKEQHYGTLVTKMGNVGLLSNLLFSYPFTVLSLGALMHEFARCSRWSFMELLIQKNSPTLIYLKKILKMVAKVTTSRSQSNASEFDLQSYLVSKRKQINRILDNILDSSSNTSRIIVRNSQRVKCKGWGSH